VARRLGRELPLTVRTTSLAAHALPPEFAGRADDYIDAVCAWLPVLQRAGLVDAVDAFCDHIGFTPAQTERVFEAAQAWACRSSCMPSSSATRAAPRWRRATAR
jgi:imidazolonepropionase